MIKKLCLIVILISFTIIASSCWNRRELNDLAIATSLGIDKFEDQYKVSLQVVSPQEVKEPSYYTPVTVYSETAKSIFEAFRRMTTEAPRKIYLPHFRILVIGEELAKEGIFETLDMLIRDHEFRSDFYIVVAKEGLKAEDILSVMTPLEKIPANEKFSSLKTSNAAWAPTIAIYLDDLLVDLATEGKEPVLTGIKILGDKGEQAASKENVEKLEPNSLLKFHGIGVFKDDKLIGWLNEQESKGYNYIIGNVQSTVGRIKCPNGGELVVEVKKSESEIIPHMKNGQPEIEIKLNSTVNVAEVKCEVDLKDPKTIVQLESALEEQQKNILIASVKAAQEKFNSDIFGFGNMIHKSYPKQWKKLKSTWADEQFKKLPVTYSVKGIINTTGTLDQSFYSDFLKEEGN